MLKEKTLRNNIPLPKVYGPSKAKIGIISWGSNWGTILDVLKTNQFKITNKQLGSVPINYIPF